jgi:O-antigen biosynthesis protein
VSDLMQAHRALCSNFVSEELFRRTLGGSRADLGTVARYLRMPSPQRPMLSVYFDRAFYVGTQSRLEHSDIDPLVHFIESGIGALLSPHPLIDLAFIASQDPHILGTPPTVGSLIELLEYDLAAPSPYFDPQDYRERLGSAAPAHGMLRHFLTEGLQAGHTPNPYLDPVWYAVQHADVPDDPYMALRHFIVLGDIEGRRAGPRFDGQFYLSRYEDIAAAGQPPLRHYLLNGRAEGRQLPSEKRITRAAQPSAPIQPSGIALPIPVDAETTLRADGELRTLLARMRQRRKDSVSVTPPQLIHAPTPRDGVAGLAFPAAPAPRLSILIPIFNEIDYTVDCLLAIAAALPQDAFEVVVGDDCSTDPDAALLAEIPNLVLLRQKQNLGFIRNCNAAFAHCQGEYVLLLNNDAKPLPGALDRMVAALDEDAGLAAVGPKIIYPNGRLQEAGCFLRPNGESGMVGLFADPDEPGFCYDRDVAYCSGAALMFRRALAGPILFDEAFLPAYCEDADLCLRFLAAGHRVRYLHEAVVVHHLSVSTNRQNAARKHRQIVRNQQTLSERWGELIRQLDRVRVLAFYLPQFHPTPENDLWWGPGFTEWTNVARAQPSYAGHYQPHLPADLGFYDLRAREALERQAQLAARYGIEGFCVYYYNFGSQRVLSRPLEVVRANPDIAFNWCLCWANENWTRHWDGGDREILLEQSYDAATLDAIIADAVMHAADPRYIRVNGKPIFLVYRPLLLPDARAFADTCRAAFARAGHAGVHLVYVESMEAVDSAIRPADLGFDACVEFPPHGLAAPAETPAAIVKPEWSGYRYDYPETVVEFVRRETVPYPRYPAVFPSWDNTPRQPLKGTSFDAASPEAFRVYVEEKIEEIRQFLMGEERLLFVNAWNEWAEGAHLEPDTGYGHRWLEALRDAIAAKRVS